MRKSRTKLTEDQVAEIRGLIPHNVVWMRVAEFYGVSKSCIEGVVDGLNHRYIKPVEVSKEFADRFRETRYCRPKPGVPRPKNINDLKAELKPINDDFEAYLIDMLDCGDRDRNLWDILQRYVDASRNGGKRRILQPWQDNRATEDVLRTRIHVLENAVNEAVSTINECNRMQCPKCLDALAKLKNVRAKHLKVAEKG